VFFWAVINGVQQITLVYKTKQEQYKNFACRVFVVPEQSCHASRSNGKKLTCVNSHFLACVTLVLTAKSLVSI